jgi:hypothetical protein
MARTLASRIASFTVLVSWMVLTAPAASASYVHLADALGPDGPVTGHPHLGGAARFTLLGSKWDPGPNAASTFVIPPGTPGSATWSLMPSGLGLDIALANPTSPFFDPDHSGPTTAMDALLGLPHSNLEEIAAINGALNVWDAASGFTNLGMVLDGMASAGGPAVTMAHLGDIRIGAYPFIFGVLAGSFLPGTEVLFGPGGTAGGDVHMNNAVTWVDDVTDLFSDPDVDFFTVMLHELGHALGLGHSSDTSAVMHATYMGGRRTLSADDVRAIQAIYGPPAPVPGPGGLALLCLGALLLSLPSRPKAGDSGAV